MSPRRVRGLIRANVHRLEAYLPGEQPKIRGLVKLNTNENPYPPSPKVLAAVRHAVDARLRLYPPPTSDALRQELARFHSCSAANIIVGNGSDELLAMATRAFVDPAPDVPHSSAGSATPRANPSRSTVQYFDPSYSLYPVLPEIHAARSNPVRLGTEFEIPSVRQLRAGGDWDFRAALSLITTPHAPRGRGYSTVELEAICAAQRGVVLLDEAYADFARENALSLALNHPNVLVARTFSKAYSLCFQRVGYLVGHPVLINALDKIRDSYNVNGLGQIAALETLKHIAYYHANIRRVILTRDRLHRELSAQGFHVFPSQTNFLLCRPPRFPAPRWLKELRDRKILVRWFDAPAVRDYLRITIGTDAEADALTGATKEILNRLLSSG